MKHLFICIQFAVRTQDNFPETFIISKLAEDVDEAMIGLDTHNRSMHPETLTNGQPEWYGHTSSVSQVGDDLVLMAAREIVDAPAGANLIGSMAPITADDKIVNLAANLSTNADPSAFTPGPLPMPPSPAENPVVAGPTASIEFLHQVAPAPTPPVISFGP